MNTGDLRKKVLRKIDGLELAMLVNVDTYTNKDKTETKLTPVRFLMSGGKYGSHSISIDSSLTRVSVHWKGYLIANDINVSNLKVKDIYFN